MGATASDFNNDGFVDLNITDFGSPRTLMGKGDEPLLTQPRPPVR